MQGLYILLIVAEQRLGLLVKEDDLPLHIRGNNTIDGAIDKIVEKSIAASELAFEVFLLGDIDEVKKVIFRCGWGENDYGTEDAPFTLPGKFYFMAYLAADSATPLFKMVSYEEKELTVMFSEDFPQTGTIDRTVRNPEKSTRCRIGMDDGMILPDNDHAVGRFFENGMQIVIRAQIFEQGLCIPVCC
jgi:hypothetical protein